MFHVSLERGALHGILGTSVQKDHHLISGEKGGVEIAPIRRRVETKVVFGCHLRKPALGLMKEADVRQILSAREKSNDTECRIAGTGAEDGTAKDECRDSRCLA